LQKIDGIIQYLKMNTYLLIIKSHTEIPDFESEIDAKNRKDAIDIFYKELRGEFDKKFIEEHMAREYKNGKFR